MNSREAFEKWAKSERYDLTISSTDESEYSKASTCGVWFAWQACEQRYRAQSEPVAYIHRNEHNEYRLEPKDNFNITAFPMNVDVDLFAHAMPKSEPQPTTDISELVRIDAAISKRREEIVQHDKTFYTRTLMDADLENLKVEREKVIQAIIAKHTVKA